MSQLDSDEGPLTFCDVAAHFSEEEWKLLQRWQKELYENVMKELHQALSSLGPLIATSVFSIRPKEKEGLCSRGLQVVEVQQHINPSSGNITVHCENQYLRDRLDAGETESLDGPSPGQGEHMGLVEIGPVVSFEIKSEEEAYFTEQLDSERRESFTNTTRHVEIAPVASFNVKREEEAYFSERLDSERRESFKGTRFPYPDIDSDASLREAFFTEEEQEGVTCRISEPEVTLPDASITVNKERGTYAIGIQDYQRRGHFESPTGHRSLNRKRNVGNSLKCHDKSTLYRSMAKKLKEKSPESQKTCQKNSNVGHKLKGSYTCNDCGKIFSAMANLTRHERIHTGERPYHCNICGKSFNQKAALCRHQQIHTGERPYQCTECGKSFNLKHHLLSHQNTHKKAQQHLETMLLQTVSSKVCQYQSYTPKQN